MHFFQSPLPLVIEGEVDASRDGSPCTQTRGGQEDCLFINVYTTQVDVTSSNHPSNKIIWPLLRKRFF